MLLITYLQAAAAFGFGFSFLIEEYCGNNVYLPSLLQLLPTVHYILATSLPTPIDYSVLSITYSSSTKCTHICLHTNCWQSMAFNYLLKFASFSLVYFSNNLQKNVFLSSTSIRELAQSHTTCLLPWRSVHCLPISRQ